MKKIKGIYQKGKNWYIDFWFHGQRVRRMIGPSRQGAEAVISKIKAEIAENKFLDKQKEIEPISFHDFAVEYMEWARVNKRASTYTREKSTMRRLERKFGRGFLHEITAEQIEKYKVNRLKEDVGPSSVNRELALLKHMFTKAIEWGKVGSNPAKGVKLLDGENERCRYLMPHEIQILLSNCHGLLNDLVTVAVNTGLRKSELFTLRWEDVNLDLGFITILKTNTKSKKTKHVSLNKTVKEVLKGIVRNGPYVFHTKDGEPLKYSTIRKSFDKAVKESGIDNFRFHDLRHTFASNLVMDGTHIMKVKELMGHESLEMTNRYSHLSPESKQEAVDRLDQRYRGEPEEELKEELPLTPEFPLKEMPENEPRAKS